MHLLVLGLFAGLFLLADILSRARGILSGAVAELRNGICLWMTCDVALWCRWSILAIYCTRSATQDETRRILAPVLRNSWRGSALSCLRISHGALGTAEHAQDLLHFSARGTSCAPFKKLTNLWTGILLLPLPRSTYFLLKSRNTAAGDKTVHLLCTTTFNQVSNQLVTWLVLNRMINI